MEKSGSIFLRVEQRFGDWQLHHEWFRLDVDGVVVAKMRPGQTVSIAVAPGRHRVRLWLPVHKWFNSFTYVALVGPHETIRLSYSRCPVFGFGTIRPSLEDPSYPPPFLSV